MLELPRHLAAAGVSETPAASASVERYLLLTKECFELWGLLSVSFLCSAGSLRMSCWFDACQSNGRSNERQSRRPAAVQRQTPTCSLWRGAARAVPTATCGPRRRPCRRWRQSPPAETAATWRLPPSRSQRLRRNQEWQVCWSGRFRVRCRAGMEFNVRTSFCPPRWWVCTARYPATCIAGR